MENYIEDILNELIERALELRESANDNFNVGKLFGYYEVISMLLNQIEAFGISEKISQHNFNPEDLLIKVRYK